MGAIEHVLSWVPSSGIPGAYVWVKRTSPETKSTSSFKAKCAGIRVGIVIGVLKLWHPGMALLNSCREMSG